MRPLLRQLAYCGLLLPYLALGQTTVGTEFWLGYMENLDLQFNDAPVFTLVIQANTSTTGAIEVPPTGLAIPFDVTPGVTEIPLPPAIWYAFGSESIANRGIRIVSEAPIQVSAFHYRLYFSESSQVLPTQALGSDYLVTAITDNAPSSRSSFVIVATADATEVVITPSVLTLELHPAGIPFTVSLDEGQSYQVQAVGDLSGTRVSTVGGEPVAVFQGARQANIGNCSADSHVWDQALPTDAWGNLYYFLPFQGQGGDFVRILAAEEGTEVYFDCEQVAMLAAGATFSSEIADPTVISATAPIHVTQYNQGQGCNASGLGDPNALTYLPAGSRSTNARWLASDNSSGGINYFAEHFVSLVAPTNAPAGISLDGAPVPAAAFSPFPGDPSWSYFQQEVGTGSHQVEAPAGVQVYAYGFGDFDGYTQHGGYTQREEVDFGCLQLDVDGLFCVDSLLQFGYTSNLELTDFAWDFGNGATSTLPHPLYGFPEAGTFTVTLTAISAQGAEVAAELTVTVADCGDAPCEPEEVTLAIEVAGFSCEQQNLNFSFSADFPATNPVWDFGDQSEQAGGAGVAHFYEQAGAYEVVLSVEDAIGCTYQTSLMVTVEICDPCIAAGEQTLAFTGTPCVDSLLTFSTSYQPGGIPVVELAWNFSDGQSAFELSPSLRFDNAGTYNADFLAFDAAGCSYTGQLSFAIDACGSSCNNLPPLFIEGPTDLCVGEEVTYTGSSEADLISLFWDTGFSQTAGPAFTTSFDQAGNVDLLLVATDASGCDYLAEIVITVEDCENDCSDLAETAFATTGPLCVDSLFGLSAVVPGTEVQLTWNLPGGGTSSEMELTDLNFTNAGDYAFGLFVQRGDGCTLDTTFTVTLTDCGVSCEELPPLSIELGGVTCVDSTVTLRPTISGVDLITFNWSVDGFALSEASLVEWQAGSAGTFVLGLSATDTEGCDYFTRTTVDIETCEPPAACALMFPNVFSPNEDGTNDVFRAFFEAGCRPEYYELRVFNRWGALVFETDNPDFGWNGRVNEKPHPAGVLVYWCRYRHPGGEEEERAGDLTLVR